MNEQDAYIRQVTAKLPTRTLRTQVATELRGMIADRVERGQSVQDAIRQFGDPAALAESYLANVPLVKAPLARRLGAKALDVLVVLAILAVPAFAMIVTFYVAPSHMEGDPLTRPWILWPLAYTALMGLIGASFYTVIAEAMTGQTLGKRVFGLRVVRESGTRISFGQALLRQLPLALQISMVDALFALFTEKRQRAFELITKTRVVRA